MFNFEFCSPTYFYFGRGAEDQIGTALKKAGASKILIHYGQGSVVRSGLLDKAKAQLDAEGIAYVEQGGAVPNPRAELAEEGAAICRAEAVDYILALGGGSALDSAKAIAVLAKSEHSLYEIYCENAPLDSAIPVATVMTFPATGSEGSPSSVINFPKQGVKRGLTSDLIRPAIAFLNPELSMTLPKEQTFNGIADMMAHTMERYFNDTANNNLIDAWSEALLREVMQSALVLYKEPENYDARATIMWASMVAHNGLLSAGIEKEDWSSHQLEHELSYTYDVAHGAGLAVVYPNWLRYAAKQNPHKIARFAREVFGISGDLRDLEGLAMRGIAALQSFFRSVGLPLTFAELGCKEEDIPMLAANVKYNAANYSGNYIKVYEQDAIEIYKLCCAEPLV